MKNKSKKLKLFGLGALVAIIATIAYAVDKRIYAPSGELILDASTTIRADKDFGIGTTPTTPLHISSSDTTLAQFISTASGDKLEFVISMDHTNSIFAFGSTYTPVAGRSDAANSFAIQTDGGSSGGLSLTSRAGEIKMFTNGTANGNEALTLETDQDAYFRSNVGIQVSPTVALHVNGNSTITRDSTSTTLAIGTTTATDNFSRIEMTAAANTNGLGLYAYGSTHATYPDKTFILSDDQVSNGMEIQTKAGNTDIVNIDGNMNFKIDENNDSSGAIFNWYTNDSTVLMSLNESATLDVNGTITPNNADIGADSDIAASIGRGRLGYNGSDSDVFVISHYDQMGTTNYALKTNSSGKTTINSASGQVLDLSINNVAALEVETDGDAYFYNNVGIGITPTVDLHINKADENIDVNLRSTGTTSNQVRLELIGPGNNNGISIYAYGTTHATADSVNIQVEGDVDGDFIIGTTSGSDADMIFKIKGSNSLVLEQADGDAYFYNNVGIGITPTVDLHINKADENIDVNLRSTGTTSNQVRLELIGPGNGNGLNIFAYGSSSAAYPDAVAIYADGDVSGGFYLETTDGDMVFKIDRDYDSSNALFKWYTEKATATDVLLMQLDEAGVLDVNGESGTSGIDVYNSGTSSSDHVRLQLLVNGDAAGDPYIQFNNNNSEYWTLGLDNSDEDRFKIGTGSTLPGDAVFVANRNAGAGYAGAIMGRSLYSEYHGQINGGGSPVDFITQADVSGAPDETCMILAISMVDNGNDTGIGCSALTHICVDSTSSTYNSGTVMASANSSTCPATWEVINTGTGNSANNTIKLNSTGTRWEIQFAPGSGSNYFVSATIISMAGS